MSTTTLLDMQSALVTQLQQDSRSALARLVAWLDPAALQNGMLEDDEYYADENPFGFAMHLCRTLFVDVYAEVAAALVNGAGEKMLAYILCRGLNRHMVYQLHSIYDLQAGVPFRCYGIHLFSDEDGYENADEQLQQRLNTVLELLAHPTLDAEQVARLLMDDLKRYDEGTPEYSILVLLGWMFNATGNTLMDFTDEDLWDSGFETPDWSPEGVELANEVQREADELHKLALAGLSLLETNNQWRSALKRNVKKLKKGDNDHVRHLRWPASAE